MRLQLSNHVAVELLCRKREFLGLGAISVGAVKLRNPERPFLIRANTPEGVLYARFQIAGIRKRPDRVEIELRAEGLPWGRTEHHDEYNQQMIAVGHNFAPVAEKLMLVIAPARLELGGREWVGFSYAFEFASRARKIHRLWTEATWEIGGSITGNTVLHQGHCNRPVYRGAKNTLFTTHCLKTLRQYGSPQGSSFQLAPRGGLLQTFDFQYAKQGALFQFWPRMESIVSLIESPPGSTRLHVIDEYRFKLSHRARTAPKWVLFASGSLDEHEARDLWWAAHEHVNGGIRARFGVQPTVVASEVGLKYETRMCDGKLRMTIAGKEADSAEAPYSIADRLLPRLAEQGIRRFFPEVMSESDVTQLGLRRKLDGGVHGDLHCASVCATHRFLPSEFWGGLKAWRYMYDKAHALGIELGAWFAPHFSPRSPIYQQHPEYRMIEHNSQPAGGGYSFQTLVTADWNTGIYDWVLADLRRWKREGGLDYLFTDSWPNLGLLPMNYAANMRANFVALGRLYRDIQKLGIKILSFEGISPFGVTRIGLADLRGDRIGQDRAVAGQNDFGWWIGNEDMAFGMCLAVRARNRAQQELRQTQFRAMANRAYILWDDQHGLDHRLPNWWARHNRLFNQALPFMTGRRQVLPDGAGVCWESSHGRLVWTFRDWTFDRHARRVERLDGESFIPMNPRNPRALPAWGVYRLFADYAAKNWQGTNQRR
ncbi:MAG: hypothetical protein HY360_12830 [Verrucomicrobia bacterium]|nr:hypothetical protein [Verrucomicrobiota bacterium]